MKFHSLFCCYCIRILIDEKKIATWFILRHFVESLGRNEESVADVLYKNAFLRLNTASYDHSSQIILFIWLVVTITTLFHNKHLQKSHPNSISFRWKICGNKSTICWTITCPSIWHPMAVNMLEQNVLYQPKSVEACANCSSTKQTMCRTNDEHGVNRVATFLTRA